jgi:hypothetical protein
MTSSRKLAVRIALATGSSVATVLGAQMIALQQGSITQPVTPPLESSPEVDAGAVPEATALLQEATTRAVPLLDIQHAAPSIVILRQPGAAQDSQFVAAAPQNNRAIVPPQPVAIAAPPPIVVQSDPVYVQPPPVVVAVSGSSGSSGNSNSGGSQTPRSQSSR